ncbi:TetR/AcrR family transcriptional regulator [Nocardia sp. NPDC088792]|uniref:TetR/AcrR family transcriptional regulator n=1 Tax=Nocardia sp. NPDC088792 TaxID=3364332 RepID=UPI00381E331C
MTTRKKGEATKARILEAATDLLVRGNDVNLDDVMRLTSTSKGQLFHYFPAGKDELRRAAAERHLARIAETDAPTVALTSWQGWEAWIEQILRVHDQQTINDACEIAALAGRALDTDQFTRELVGRMYEGWIEQLGRQLDSMRRDGLLRPDTPVTELASAFVAALQGGAVMDKATGSHQHLTHALNQALALLRSYGHEGQAPGSVMAVEKEG